MPNVRILPLAQVEREHILATLRACGGRKIDTAAVLGIAKTTLHRKLREYAAQGHCEGPRGYRRARGAAQP